MAEASEKAISRTVVLKAQDAEKRIVWAEVYVPSVIDTDGEFMSAEDIEVMAYKFMRELRLKSVDSRHDNVLVDGACVVESFIARKDDPTFIEGAWVIGLHVDNDEVWSQIKKGELNGFSMEAWVSRDPMELEIDVPPVISGRTCKGMDCEEHEHEFFVTYDPKGNLLGGRTGAAKGHVHTIKAGTVTELAGDPPHRHRFSFIEQLRAK